MNRCVNINHPEFKELLNQSSLDPISLAADVSIWQDKNDTDLFPTLRQLNPEVLYQKDTDEGIVASEKTIRDLAARMSDRIGIPVRIISDRSQNFKGKLETGVAVVNLAYASLDTPIHEILGHPIIRALKGSPELRVGDKVTYSTILGDKTSKIKTFSKATGMAELEDGSDVFGGELTKVQSPLFNNLLKELESGRGKEVLDRIKRDYHTKENKYITIEYENDLNHVNGAESFLYKGDTYQYELTFDDEYVYQFPVFTKNGKEIEFEEFKKAHNEYIKTTPGSYTLEEQQEEAIVELLGMMTAERLDAVKDGKLISLLKRLLKEIKAFIKDLLRQREVEVDQLPDNMTLGDLADLLAYSNSKLILPGNEVVYTTPDNQTFKTYREASNHISELTKNVQDVDLSDVKVEEKSNVIPDSFTYEQGDYYITVKKEGDIWKHYEEHVEFEDYKNEFEIPESQAFYEFKALSKLRDDFIDKNREYEMSKEIIEEWMKVNGVRYNPEEIYSRGQEFVSIVGAYSSFDVNLMMQNLLQHIEDNQKAGGEFAVSAITKPVDRKIGHLEGGGGKIRFKIYPQGHDILWAANADVYSGSVWDAGEKINKDKKSELLGVTYSKYPALNNLSSIKPNLAEIVEDLDHHHNELGIALTGSNFRLDYDDDIPYTTKKIIDSINRILDQKYGKLRKPEIKIKDNNQAQIQIDAVEYNKAVGTVVYMDNETTVKKGDSGITYTRLTLKTGNEYYKLLPESRGVQPKLTSKDLKESIESVKSKLAILGEGERQTAKDYLTMLKGMTLQEVLPVDVFDEVIFTEDSIVYKIKDKSFTVKEADQYTPEVQEALSEFAKKYGKALDLTFPFYYEESPGARFRTKEEAVQYKTEQIALYTEKLNKTESSKEYTEQALINTKIAKLKEVAKKYPRALIRSEVRKIQNADYSTPDLFEDEELPFQKVPSKPELNDTKLKSLLEHTGFSLVTLSEYETTVGKKFNVNALVDMSARLVAMADGASTSALTEEIAHIAALQAEGTKEFDMAMKLIETYDKFDQYYEQYYPVYEESLARAFGRTPTVEEVDLHTRKEILGKALKEDLEVKLGTSLGMWLRRLWNKFLSIFRNNDLRSYVSRITDEFVANPERDVKDDKIYFQLGEEEKTLQQQVNKLNRRYKELTRRQKSNPALLSQIRALEEELEGNKNGVGIYKFLQLLNDDTKNAIDFIQSYFTITEKNGRAYLGSRTSKEAPSDKMTHQLAMYIGYYLPFLKELNMVLDEDSVIGDGRKKVLDKMIRTHVENFEVINRAYSQFLRENNNESTESAELDIAGQRIMSANELREAPRDSNFLETWFGLARNNSDTLVRLAHRTITDIKNKIRRAVLNWSDDLLANSIDYIGKDMSWVAERVTVDEVNKKTGEVKNKLVKSGNFISEVHQGQWDLAREQFHTSLHDRYGFSQDFAERLKEKKTIQSYNAKTTDKFQKEEIQRLKDYNQEIAKWYTANSIPNPRMKEIMVERKAALSPEQYEFWKLRNMELNKDGSVRYYKGELVSPSRGKTKTLQYGDKIEYVKTVDWTNKDYFKLSEKDRTFLQYLKDQKKEIDKSIPFAVANRLPQMYESTLDIMRLNEPEVFKRLKKNIASSIIREEDDTEFNDTPTLNDGTILDDVPIRFTGLLGEPDRVTTDILSSLIAYKQMQENYVQMSAQLPMFENWLQGSKRRVVRKGDKVIRGEDSWSFNALRQFLEVHVSGKEKEDLTLTILGTKVSVTKAVEKLSQWVRMKNLGFNFITMTSNLISSKVFATLESIVGTYTTTKSSAFANKEFFSILPTVISSFNGVRSTDRISSLMTYFGLGRDIREMFDDLDKHVLMRNQPDKTLMYGFEKGDYFTKSVVMIAILDNYRVLDNKWYTSKEALAAGLNFDEMTSAYNMIKTDKDGKVNHSIPESVINNITARMKTIASRVDGSLSPEDKGAIYQNAVFSMVGLHRGWLFEGLSRRLKSKGYDFTLNQITEGEYRTVADLIGRFFMSTQKLRSIKEYLAKYNELEDYQKENLKRVMLELSMIGAFTVLALFLNSGDDDEEDYFRDLLAYQSNRVLLEVSSFYNPNEFVSAIKDPIVPARDLELVTNFTDMFNTKEIESGKWEGMTKQQKYFLQLVPGIKGYSVFQDPASQNQFLRQKPLKPIYSAYEFFVGEEEK